MCRCVVSRSYIDVCNCNVFSVGNVYLDNSVLSVLMVEGTFLVVNVMLSLTIVMSTPPDLCDLFVFLCCGGVGGSGLVA